MGYSVLYIAFGIVALWLLGEVLLQYKARLRWRLLAFSGFLGVVGGVYLREVIVIVLGALAFGAGQSFVTLSYKRGFSTGWAVGGRPGSSRRRRGSAGRDADEPVLEVTPIEEDFAAAYAATSGSGAFDEDDETSVFAAHEPVGPPDVIYATVPMHDDSGEYPLYDGQSTYTPDPYTSGGYEGYGAQGYAGWGVEAQPEPAAADYDAAYGGGYDQSGGWGGGQAYGYDPQQGYQEQQTPAFGYGYDTQGSGEWPAQPHPEQQQEPQPQADPYGYTYGYDPQQQPYIPQQQHQPVYEQPQQPADYPEYADPYDPYRY